jgi:hypothetical protein
MLVALLLGLVLLAIAAAFLYYRQGKLAKELKELQSASESYVTLDDWEGSVQPKLDGLEQRQAATRRQLAMLSASVRGLQATAGEVAAPPPELPEDGDDDEDEAAEVVEAHAAAAEAAHAEDQLQAMLSSVANIFGMGAGAGLASNLGAPELRAIPTTHLFISRMAQQQEPARAFGAACAPLIEEEEDEKQDEEEEEEVPVPQPPR